MHEMVQKPRTARAVGVVQAVHSITPHMRRITVGGSGIAEFLHMEGIDEAAAWVKVFLPSGEGRAYTVRSVDFQAGTLDLDFVLHGTGPDSGPASAWAWASQASVGEPVGIAGPRSGGFLLPGNARWVMLAGDATALPAIQSIASCLPASTPRSMPSCLRQRTSNPSPARPGCAPNGSRPSRSPAWACASPCCTAPCRPGRATSGWRESPQPSGG
ncbi:hypothetical protein GCM10027082_30960 [Comamonas humi]